MHWMANPKAWMTTAIFTEWLNDCFVPEVEAYMKEKSLDFKVLLIVYNAARDGFNTFNHDDIDELLVDDALSDNDIIDLTLDLTVDGVVGLEGDNDEDEKSTPLTGKLIQEGLQLCSKLENHFLSNDPNSERASKLQQAVSSDGDLEPLRKRCKPLSDSDND
ncbi:hypothetical protein TNCV_1572021 [Trichonephila clavipes]|uniref:DDE-1 domain-containing protein n=1 Tax=Trichonephila clavipes TaxID=2585209 RepID=A0A8X6SNH6_TRICX|nr:hypothetical protein TNCV_1572021 [Trichonephila clavipes]